MLGIKGKLASDNGTPQGFSGDDSVLNPKDVSGASGCAFNIPCSKSDQSAGLLFRLAGKRGLSCPVGSSHPRAWVLMRVRPVGDGG